MTENAWLWAAVAVGSGLLVGEIGGSIVRASMGRTTRKPDTREHAARWREVSSGEPLRWDF